MARFTGLFVFGIKKAGNFHPCFLYWVLSFDKSKEFKFIFRRLRLVCDYPYFI